MSQAHLAAIVLLCCAVSTFCTVASEASNVELSRYYGKKCNQPIIPHGQLKGSLSTCYMGPGPFVLTCGVQCDAGYYPSRQYDVIHCNNGEWEAVQCLPFAGPLPQKYCQLSFTGIFRRQTPLHTLSVTSDAECAKACVDNIDCMASLFKQDSTSTAPSTANCTLYLQAGPIADPCPAGVTCTNHMCIDQRPPPQQCPQAAKAGKWSQATVLDTLIDDGRISTVPATCQLVCERNINCKAATHIVSSASLYQASCVLFSALNCTALEPCAGSSTCTSFSC